jgi:hypothetical protein
MSLRMAGNSDFIPNPRIDIAPIVFESARATAATLIQILEIPQRVAQSKTNRRLPIIDRPTGVVPKQIGPSRGPPVGHDLPYPIAIPILWAVTYLNIFASNIAGEPLGDIAGELVDKSLDEHRLIEINMTLHPRTRSAVPPALGVKANALRAKPEPEMVTHLAKGWHLRPKRQVLQCGHPIEHWDETAGHFYKQRNPATRRPIQAMHVSRHIPNSSTVPY